MNNNEFLWKYSQMKSYVTFIMAGTLRIFPIEVIGSFTGFQYKKNIPVTKEKMVILWQTTGNPCKENTDILGEDYI